MEVVQITYTPKSTLHFRVFEFYWVWGGLERFREGNTGFGEVSERFGEGNTGFGEVSERFREGNTGFGEVLERFREGNTGFREVLEKEILGLGNC
jgi:hypothetical protein